MGTVDSSKVFRSCCKLAGNELVHIFYAVAIDVTLTAGMLVNI